MQAENDDLRKRMDELMNQFAAMQGASLPEAADISRSPFKDWTDDDIRLWLEENGGEKPHHRAGHDRLVSMADRRNAELAKLKEAA